MRQINQIYNDENGGAIVEATFVFPIIIMIICGLVILSLYLPIKGILQYATQRAANAISIEMSDTWVKFDNEKLEFSIIENYDKLDEEGDVYKSAIGTIFSDNNELITKAESIVNKLYDESVATKKGNELKIDVKMKNAVIYKEITVSAEKTIPMISTLSYIGFPSELNIKSSSTAVVQNGDEMVRNMDIARDVTIALDKKYKISEQFASIGELFGK